MSEPVLRLIEGGGNLVAFIEAMLDRARNGEIRTLAIAEVHPEGTVATGIAWGPGDPARFYPTLGAIAQLNHDLLIGELNFPSGD